MAAFERQWLTGRQCLGDDVLIWWIRRGKEAYVRLYEKGSVIWGSFMYILFYFWLVDHVRTGKDLVRDFDGGGRVSWWW